MERTLSIIKPDAVRRHLTGNILAMIEQAQLRIVALKMLHLSKKTAAGFYAVHEGKPFYPALVEYMSSGPIVCAVLEGEGAITRYRKLMGNTDPKEAAVGSIRHTYAVSLQQNSVHGSDATETALQEIAYFFTPMEIQYYD